MAKKMADFFGKAGKPLLNIFLFLVVPLCIAAVSRRYDYNSAWGKTVRFLISPAIVNTLMAAGYLTVLFIRVLRAKLKPELLDGFGIFMLFYIGLRVPQDFLTSIAGFYFTPLSILYLMILLSCMVYYKGSEHAASVIKKIALYMKKKASGTGNVLKKTSEKSIKAIGETSKTSIQKVASIKDKRKK
ncbi:MAG: hypothetical protein LLG37_01180, partial [Spirochaetia bacterium]|nr:hypothetical protein [Spirochaetia bacterium]